MTGTRDATADGPAGADGCGWAVRAAGRGRTRRASPAATVACWREAYSALVPDGFFDATRDGWGPGAGARRSSPRPRCAPRSPWPRATRSSGSRPAPARRGRRAADPRPRRRGGCGCTRCTCGPALHGCGVAAGLLVRLVVGDRPAYLWVFEDNPRARAFYARHGFRRRRHRTVGRVDRPARGPHGPLSPRRTGAQRGGLARAGQPAAPSAAAAARAARPRSTARRRSSCGRRRRSG